ncbi:MAG: site-specific integrase [Clostridia bacterium]|nr:site-specific integrase [Clostridia bacterium]
MKYEDWLNEWFENYIAPTAKSRTYSVYTILTEKHIVPKLGGYDLDELSLPVLQHYVTELLQCGNLKTGNGLAANSVNAIINIIQNSMEMAYNLGYIIKNVSEKIKRPKTEEKAITCFSVAEQKKIEQAVLSDSREKVIGILICLYTGLRIGEVLALTWEDIDFKSGLLTVSKSCHDGLNKEGKYVRICDTPKTSSSIRVIPLPKQILPILKHAKKKNRSEFVVSSGEKVLFVRSYQRTFELLLNKLKIPHKGFHALRHTFATRALECGMDVKTLSEILGHRSPTVTLNRYAHSMLEHKREMMNKVGKLL